MSAPLTCQWFDEWENDDGGITVGLVCGEPALFMSCMPMLRTPTCAKHKCRCAKPLAKPLAQPPATTSPLALRWTVMPHGTGAELVVGDGSGWHVTLVLTEDQARALQEGLNDVAMCGKTTRGEGTA